MIGFDPIYMLVMAVTFGISTLVSSRLKSKFKEYSQVPLRNGMTGKDIAEKMLHDNGIYDVKIISVAGQLTDHYNPGNKTVNLSDWVYDQNSVAAAAVAAHEVGHAIQHATAYRWLQFRSKMVPTLQISSKFTNWILMAGLALAAFSGNIWVLAVGIGLFAVTTLFSFITLPVEFDASNRALLWLNGTGITAGVEHEKAKDALKWAAMTYVVAAIGSLAQLMYFVFRMLQYRDR